MDCLREDNIASPAPLAASATLPSSPEKIIVPYGTVLAVRLRASSSSDYGGNKLPRARSSDHSKIVGPQIVAAGPLVDVSPCSSMSGVTPPRGMERGRLFFKEAMMRVCCDALFSAGRVCVFLFAVPPQGLKSFL